MGRREIYFCDRSKREIDTPEPLTGTPDLLISVPWIRASFELGTTGRTLPIPSGPNGANTSCSFGGYEDLCDSDRRVVASLIARLFKVDVQDLDARSISGEPLFEKEVQDGSE